MTTTAPLFIAQDKIDEVCGANSTWAQTLSEYGLLTTLNLDVDFLEGSDFTDYIAEEYNLSDEDAYQELVEFLTERREWKPADLIRHMAFALEFPTEFGNDPEMIGEAIYDFAKYNDAPEVIDAFLAAAAGNDYEQELLDGANEGWIPSIANDQINEAMTQVTTKRVHNRLDEILEANTSWVDSMNLFGLLTTVGFELDLQDADWITETAIELDIDDEYMIKGVLAYITRFVWTREKLADNIVEAKEMLLEYGDEDEVNEGFIYALT